MEYGGDDTYLFNRGDGQDNIIDQAGNDTIVFGYGLSKSDITFRKTPQTLKTCLLT